MYLSDSYLSFKYIFDSALGAAKFSGKKNISLNYNYGI